MTVTNILQTGVTNREDGLFRSLTYVLERKGAEWINLVNTFFTVPLISNAWIRSNKRYYAQLRRTHMRDCL